MAKVLLFQLCEIDMAKTPFILSLKRYELLYLENGVVLEVDRKAVLSIHGQLKFLLENHYLSAQEAKTSLTSQFRYALQEFYLNGKPVEGVQKAAEALSASVKSLRPAVREILADLANKQERQALLAAIQLDKNSRKGLNPQDFTV